MDRKAPKYLLKLCSAGFNVEWRLLYGSNAHYLLSLN